VESVEVVVVGAGVVGLATAWRLAAAGRSVLVLERFAPGHAAGSSHGATRIFRFAYDDPADVGMAQLALPLWRELEAAVAAELLRITGGVDVGEPRFLDACAEALGSRGAAFERLDATERAARLGWLEAGDEPALFSPDTGVLAAARSVEALAQAARASGAELRSTSPVVRLEQDDDGVTLHTSGGSVRGRRCVVAAGPWTRELLEPLGIRLPLHVTREQVFYFKAPGEVIPFIHRGPIARYGVPAFGGAAGVKVAEHGTGEHTSADGRSSELDPEGEARLVAYVSQALPSFEPEPVAFETCLYTMTPDEGFIIEARAPLVIASTCSGHGFKFAPIVGEALAALATDREPPFAVDRFRLDRFN
jgi:sarcosine oxidase